MHPILTPLGFLITIGIVGLFITLILNPKMWKPKKAQTVDPDKELGKAVRNVLKWL